VFIAWIEENISPRPTALKFPGLWGLVSDFLMVGHGLDACWARRGDGFRWSL